MALELHKSIGDTFTASEFNQVVTEINKKQDTTAAVKIQLVADEAAYNAIVTKDPNTIYGW